MTLRERLARMRTSSKARRRLLWFALGLALLAFALDRGPAWYFDPRRANAANHVVVYTTAWCPVCTRLRLCLARAGVPFEERDIEKSSRAAWEFEALDGTGIPLTLAGQRIAHGMRQPELGEALAGAGFPVDCAAAAGHTPQDSIAPRR